MTYVNESHRQKGLELAIAMHGAQDLTAKEIVYDATIFADYIAGSPPEQLALDDQSDFWITNHSRFGDGKVHHPNCRWAGKGENGGYWVNTLAVTAGRERALKDCQICKGRAH